MGFDTRTADALSDVRLALPDALDLSGGPGGALLATSPDGLARIEPHTGRALWRTRVGQDVTGWTEAGGLIWARSSGQVTDRLSGLDPDTGRVVTRVELDDFGGSGITAIDDELWLSTVGGNITILTCLPARFPWRTRQFTSQLAPPDLRAPSSARRAVRTKGLPRGPQYHNGPVERNSPANLQVSARALRPAVATGGKAGDE